MLNGNIDPITFEVLSHRLHQVTREMGIALERTGGTVTTTQQHDYNASLYRPDGEIMAAGETYGHHVVCAGFAVKRILESFGKEEIFRTGFRLFFAVIYPVSIKAYNNKIEKENSKVVRS